MSEIDTEEDISMNKTQLKNFAVAARVALIERVKDRARGFGIDEKTCAGGAVIPSKMVQTLGGALLSQTEINQRDALLARIQSRGYDQVMEEAAYTWFNRFIALRYMQEHNLLPVSVRVLPDAPGALPELVRQAQNVELDGVDFSHVVELLEGNRTETLYTELLIALCNQLSDVLPQMFEPISDYTELLFPDGLLREDSVLAELARLKDEENDEIKWDNIKTIGWLYQYYNTELNELVYDGSMSKNRIPKELLSAATTIYTPHWPICYMVENSLGRLWLEGHDDRALRRRWRYYMDEAEQEPQVAAQLAQIRAQESRIQPEEIRLLDPCMGSGHILVYAFDVLMEIYRTQGYTDRDAVSAIIENNLYGLDIDDRAAQLAYFALMMKACEHDRRFLRRGVQPHVCAVAEWNGNPNDSPAWSDGQRRAARMLRETFKDAKEFGSILSIPKPLADALDELSENPFGGETALGVDAENLQRLAAQAKIMARKYDVVVTNPPYMGSSGMGARLAEFVKKQYPDSKSDLFAVFMERGLDWVKESGYTSMITVESWMFLSSFENLRKKVLNQTDIATMVHMPYLGKGGTSLGINFGTAATVLCKQHIGGYIGTFDRISYYETDDEGVPFAFPVENEYYRKAKVDNFEKIPGAPVAYWVSEQFLNAFKYHTIDERFISVTKGIFTGDNDRFLRLWYEPNHNMFEKKWFGYGKGGNFRRWYGNLQYVINWENNGEELKKFPKSGVGPSIFFGFPTIVWTKLTTSKTAFRLEDSNIYFDDVGPAFVYDHNQNKYYELAFLNSCVTSNFLNILSPTISHQCGELRKLPFIYNEKVKETVCELSSLSVNISKNDWNSFETSWDFKKHPLI